MKAKQYAWTHVVSNGQVNVEPCFYGGMEPLKFAGTTKINEALALIKEHGVNWNKTDDIETETYSEFAGTFADEHNETNYLQGWMTLNNGTKLFWISNNIESSSVFSMFDDIDDLREKFKTIFGVCHEC